MSEAPVIIDTLCESRESGESREGVLTFDSNTNLLQTFLPESVLCNVSVLKVLEEPTELRVCHS